MIAELSDGHRASGWLDVHGHYSFPQAPEEAEKTRVGFEVNQAFYLKKPFHWDYDEVLAYLDHANIGLQMLSFVPQNHSFLQKSNDFGASIVERNPSRFGLLAGLPADSAEACLAEIERTTRKFSIPADGFAMRTVYNGIWLSDKMLDPVWAELNARKAVVFIHPDALAQSIHRQCVAVVEVAFDTTRCVMDMLFAGVFRRFSDIKFVLAHAGGALPALAGRIALLGTEDWAPNPLELTKEEIWGQLKRLYLDTAASAMTGLVPAIRLVGVERCIYGSDCGVPCSAVTCMDHNMKEMLEIEHAETGETGGIGMNGWNLFPAAAKRARKEIKGTEKGLGETEVTRHDVVRQYRM